MEFEEARAMDPGSYRPTASGPFGVVYSVPALAKYVAVIRQKGKAEREVWTSEAKTALELIGEGGQEQERKERQGKAGGGDQFSLF